MFYRLENPYFGENLHVLFSNLKCHYFLPISFHFNRHPRLGLQPQPLDISLRIQKIGIFHNNTNELKAYITK